MKSLSRLLRAGVAQLSQRLGLNLTDPLSGDVEFLAHLFQRAGPAILQAEAQLEHPLLTGRQRTQHRNELLLEQRVGGGLRGGGARRRRG